MKIHQFIADEALASLHSRAEGLTSTQAQHRLKEYGRNEIKVMQGEALIIHLLKEFPVQSTGRSLFIAPLLDNHLILWGIALEIVLLLLINYTSSGNHVFGTVPLALETMLMLLPFALAMLLLEELRKFIFIRK